MPYARALAREGADVAVCDLTRIDQAKVVKDDIEAMGRKFLAVRADVTSAEEMRDAMLQGGGGGEERR